MKDKTIDHGNGLIEYISYHSNGKFNFHLVKLNGMVSIDII